MSAQWANPEHVGIIIIRDGIPVYLDSGPEYEAAIAGGVSEYAGPLQLEPPTATGMLSALASRRYAAEESGTTFNGYPLPTDRETQAKITAAYVKATADPNYAIAAWKFGPGIFAPLDSTSIIAVANVLEAHVQACFANEAALTAQILAAETPEALAAIDLEAGWP